MAETSCVAPASAASRWFGVRAEVGPAGHMLGHILRYFAWSLFTWGLTAGDFEHERRCQVVLFRRDTGQGVLTYRYNVVSEAHDHVQSLVSRLPATHVFDLCRELGLSLEHVVGPGTDEPLDPVVWDELPSPDREPW